VLPLRNLAEDLPDDRRFSRAGVPDDEQVGVLSIARDAQQSPLFLHLETYSIAGELLGEFLRINQNRSLQPPSIAELLSIRQRNAPCCTKGFSVALDS
jgi:hypothetical protein